MLAVFITDFMHVHYSPQKLTLRSEHTESSPGP